MIENETARERFEAYAASGGGWAYSVVVDHARRMGFVARNNDAALLMVQLGTELAKRGNESAIAKLFSAPRADEVYAKMIRIGAFEAPAEDVAE